MIYKLDSMPGYVISSGGSWLPGVYDCERTARYAFRFPDEVLIQVRDKVRRPITMDDLRAARTRPRTARSRP
jgi:hypothetical protein